MGVKTQRYVLFKLCFWVLSQHRPTKIMGLPPRCSGYIPMLLCDFNQAYLTSLDLEGGEWPLVCLVYPQRHLDIEAGGLAFWSKMDIFSLWVHLSEVVLQHTVELEQSVGLV